MDGKRPSHKDHAEASFPRPPKRQKSSQDDWGNGIHKSQNALLTSHDQYTIAWICTLHIEMAAAHAMLDEIHETLPTHADDSNAYILGNIKQHNVVVACLPEGRYGLNNAANVLTHLVRTFPSICAGLMVGIGGGVPSKADIRLGDIVVGTRVMQYDLGKIVGDGQMQHTAIPKIPQQLLGTAVSSLRARHEREGSRIPSILREMFEEHSEYCRPASPDCLFLSTYDHVSQTFACDECDHSKLVRRRIRETDDPLIHYGAIASGNKVMRSGTQRDSIARHLDVICFEMEAASLMDILPCLPIRGICDYSDSHKNKGWQRYAAATAASYARELLTVLPVAEACVKATYTPNPYRDLSNGSQLNPAFSSFDGMSRSNPLQMLSQNKITAEARARVAVENGLAGEHLEMKQGPFLVLPWAKNRKFVGREPFFEELLSRFRIGESYHARLALFGLRGVGKSQIAIEYAHRFRAQHSNASIFWIHAENRSRIEQGFNLIAEEIGIPGNLYPSTSILALVRSWLSKRLKGPWLMVLDNADDTNVFFGKLTNELSSHSTYQHQCLWDFLPQSPNSTILFTTRNKQLGVDLAGGGDLISVPPMEYSEAKLLFTSLLQTTEASEKSMKKLFDLLEYLPLAIAQAAAVIERNCQSLDQYLERYAQSQNPVATLEAAPPTDSGYASTAGVVINRQKLIEEYADDAATEYSVTSSTNFPEQDQYISKLVDHLATKTRTLKADKETQSRVSAILPDLLKALALRIGGQDATSIHREAMAFVYKHRCKIAEAFNAIGYQEDEDVEEEATTSDAVGWQDRIGLLWGNQEPQSLGEPPDETRARSQESQMADEDEHDTSGYLDGTNPRLLAYETTILNTVAFKWLLDRLQKELLLTPMEPRTMQKIGETIASALPLARRISRKAQPQAYRATFELEWDVFNFFRTQGYDGLPQEVFEGVITLTGCCPDAQATTCAQYLLQTWPSTSGELIEMIKIALTRGQGYLIENKLSDGTTLNVQIRDSKFLAEVYGIAATIAEIGEQLAWLGAALRTPTEDTGLAYCTPHITIDSTPFQSGNQPSESIFCLIRFTTERVTEAPTVNGQCWQALFKNPSIVRGYPIPRRAEWSTGLEAPLEIMAGLAQAHQMYHSDNKVYIKGFSTMLVATRRCGDIICWHLLQEDGSHRISHLANDLNQCKHIGGLEALENGRHVLGWCLEAELFAGSDQWSHRLIHTMLPRPGPNGALFQKYVDRGRAVMKQLNYFKGVKDVSPALAYDGYVRRLQTLDRQFVLFWDEADKRGWLLNGASALLHVVDSFLAQGSKDGSRGAFLFKREDYEDSRRAHRTLSALEILNDEKYQRLPLYREGCSHTILKSKIEDLCGVLEHFIDIQLFVMEDYASRNQPRKELEGWDITDLVTNHGTLHSRVAALDSCGKGWVDFVRDIKAVTLFGRCFGDIIHPATHEQQTCSKWASLPKGRYYIATCVSDLAKVFESHGIYPDGHIRLSNTLLWHTPRPGSEFCRCRQSGQDASDQDDCEPVQTCFPLSLAQKVKPRQDSLALADNKGALIFGQNSKFPWVWGDLNDPLECQLNELLFSSDSAEVSSTSFKDSGVGSSMTRSDLESQTSTRSRLDRCLTEPSTDYQTNSTSSTALPSLLKKAYARNHYRVGIICALPKELMAVRALLDETHAGSKNNKDDYNKYAFGRMGPHNVVATCLAEYGTNSAALTAQDMKRTFSLRFCLLVGIGGGVPSPQHDIRLGDVVVGESVVQYDLGKETRNEGFQRKNQQLQTPPLFLKSAIKSLQSDPDLSSNPLDSYLRTILSKGNMSNYCHPGSDRDILFESCSKCSSSPELCRLTRKCMRRQNLAAKIHYGVIASGNSVIGNATLRDQKAAELKAACFEMEAAGVVNAVLCLVIRGICDYCDDKKNDEWQEYAAATAAAYAKLLLMVVDEHKGGNSYSDADYSPLTRAKRRRVETR